MHVINDALWRQISAPNGAHRTGVVVGLDGFCHGVDGAHHLAKGRGDVGVKQVPLVACDPTYDGWVGFEGARARPQVQVYHVVSRSTPSQAHGLAAGIEGVQHRGVFNGAVGAHHIDAGSFHQIGILAHSQRPVVVGQEADPEPGIGDHAACLMWKGCSPKCIW